MSAVNIPDIRHYTLSVAEEVFVRRFKMALNILRFEEIERSVATCKSVGGYRRRAGDL